MTDWFHATHRDNVWTILSEGLVGEGTTAFNERGRVPEADQPPTVHLGDGPWVVDHVSDLWDISPSNIVLLKVNVDGLKTEPGWDGPGSLAVLSSIPSDRIEIV